MLESKAYQTYYAFASGEKAPKPKYIRKKADSNTSPKKKPVQANKGDRVDTQSKVPDEQQQKSSSIDEGTEGDDTNDDDSEETELDNDGDDLTYPILSTYKVEDQEEEKEDNEEVSFDQKVSTPPDYELTEEEENRDVNINLERHDAEMTDAQANQDT
ncbi:hypothetical protein Tco_0697093 [Tanacetum coccineum]